MKIRFLLWAMFFWLLAACAAPEMAYKPITLERPPGSQPQGSDLTESYSQKSLIDGPLKSPDFAKETPKKTLPPSEPIDPKRLTLAAGPVMINVEKMPLSDFIIYALGETLKVAFVMDEGLMANKTPITISMPQPMPADKALEIILGLLDNHKLYLEEKAGALYLLSKPPEAKQPFDVRVGRETPDSPANILQVVPLKFVRSQEIEPLIREMYKTGVQIKPYPRENVLILYGTASQIRQIIEFVDLFDIPLLGGKVLFLHRLTYWQTEDFIKQLSTILEGLGFSIARSPRDPGILFIPIKQLNSVLVITPDDNTARYLLDWKERLDTTEAAGTEEKSYTYFPKYTRASDLAESIKKLYQGGTSTGPGQTAVQKQTTTAPQTAGTSGQTITQPGLRLAADDAKNIIMTICPPAVYKNILTLLTGLDTPPRQVLIEATIAELTLSGDLRYGVEWYLKNIQKGGGHTLTTLGQLGLSAATGMTYQFIGNLENIKAMVQAFASDNRGKILSTPRLMVLDNKEATIQIGQDVPVVVQDLSGLTGAQTSAQTTNQNVIRSFQYRSTGIILRVKPTINTDGLLTLDIALEVSASQPGGTGDNPTILMRKINTAVVIANAQTIALGGLMREETGESLSKVPLLGDIPLLGNLFKTTFKSKDKTELLILVTPTILVNTDEGTKITETLRKELKWFK